MADTASKPTAPDDDIALIDTASRIALGSFSTDGGFGPFGLIHSGDALFLAPAESAKDKDAKREFVNVLRYLSIENAGKRTAIAMETWTIDMTDPVKTALLDEIYARGGSMSEHPDVGEAIHVIVESDAGTTMRTHAIVREADGLTLAPAQTRFSPVGERAISGTFSAFHIPTDKQSDPIAQAYASGMRGRYDAKYERIVPSDAPPAN